MTDNYKMAVLFRIISVIVLIKLAVSRDAPAKTDICTRLPSLSMCSGTKNVQQPIVRDIVQTPPTDRPSPATAPPPPPLTGKSAKEKSADKETYCKDYSVHYQYYCVGDGKGDPRAVNFCPSYNADCSPSAPPQQQGFVPAVEPLHPNACYNYRNQYMAICVNQDPATARAAVFCQTYSNTCLQQPQQAPISQVQPQPLSALPQSQFPVQTPVQPVPQQPQIPLQPEVPIQQPQIPIQQPQVPIQQPALPVQQAAVPQAGGSPLTVGSGTSVGNFANVGQQTAVNPFSGVNTGRTVGAGPVGVSSGTGVNFGGIPGLSSLSNSPLGGFFGRKRRR